MYMREKLPPKSKDKLTPPGPGASQQEWDEYLEASGYGVDKGAYKGGTRYEGFGLGVKSDEWEKREDEGEHSPMCPINLGTALTGEIHGTNDRPVEKELFGDDDDD